MSPPNVAGQIGDTAYTKVFVGGLAWETQRDTMRKYFDQFGEILEAVVITDKNTGRSKGYGFVTFREAEAALKACVDTLPVIDGRRANCNLASLGVQKTRSTTPLHGGGVSRNFRVMKSFQTSLQGGMGTAFPSPATFPHCAIAQGLPYYFYGFSPYSADYNYPTSDYQRYYNMYGGAIAQYPMYGGATAAMVNETTSSYYPYSFHYGQVGNGGSVAAPTASQGQGYEVQIQYPQMFNYSALTTTSGMTGFANQLCGGSMFITPNSKTQTGTTMALTAPTLPNPTTYPYRLIPSHFPTMSTPEQSLA